MLRELYSGVFDELEYIEDSIDDITKQIFLGKEREMVESISKMTRTLLEFKHSLDLHKDVLETLIHKGKDILGEKFSKDMDVIMLDYQKISSTIVTELELLRELRSTNNSMLSTKQNEIMKQMTVLGFIILPLNLIAWIFAMRTEGMPIIQNPNAFWIVLGIMITSALVALAWVKHKKWI
jgi:magnesium transporter